MKVIEYRKPREGREDKVWIEVKYSRKEWAFLLSVAALEAWWVSVINDAKYPTNLLGMIAFSLMMMAVFAFVIWDIVSVFAIYHARKKGMIERRTE